MLAGAGRGLAFAALLFGVAGAGAGAGADGSSLAPGQFLAAPPPALAAQAVDQPPRGFYRASLPAVAEAQPVRLLIPSLNIDAQVEALGVDRSGAMETPHNLWNVGWYAGGPSPGSRGDAVIDGHVGLPGSPLVFSGLSRLAIGADVIVVLADGTRSRFTVGALLSWPADSRPPGLFAVGGQSRLSLITCTGAYYRSSQTYADRLIVEAGYAGQA